MQINFQEKIYISLKSDNEITEIIIEDDGNGYPKIYYLKLENHI